MCMCRCLFFQRFFRIIKTVFFLAKIDNKGLILRLCCDFVGPEPELEVVLHVCIQVF